MASIQDYKKKYPKYANIPDLELAEIIYKKSYEGKIDEETFYKTAFPEIEIKTGNEAFATEDSFKETVDYLPAGKELTIGALELGAEKFTKPTVKDIATTTGVSVNNPADSAARMGGSFGYNKEQKILAIKNSLSKIYKENVEVRVGPNTGVLEYLNPQTNEYALVDAPGFDKGDFADLAGDALVIGPDLAVTYFTAGIGKAIGGGALAAGAGEFMRLKLGQIYYQVNLDLSDEQLFKEGLKTAGISLGAGVTGFAIAKAIKGVNNAINGRAFSFSDDALDTLTDVKVKEAQAITKKINDALDTAQIDSKLKFSLGKAAGDADLLAVQSAFENTRKLGYVGEFRKFNIEEANALNDYFGLLKTGFGTSTGSTFKTGNLIKEVIESRQEPAIKGAIQKLEQSESLLSKSIFNLPDGSVKVTGSEARSIITHLGDKYKLAVDKASKKLDRAAGVTNIKTDIIADTISTLSKKERTSLIEVAKIEGIFKKKLFENVADPFGEISLKSARETISVLGKKIREKELGSVTGETVDVGRLKFLQSALTEQVKKNAGTAYVDELQKFNILVREGKELLNNDIMSKLTKIEIGDKLKIAEEDIFAQTFKKTGIDSAKIAKETYDVISQSPDALTAYKNSIFNKYKLDVIDNITKKPNIAKHESFIKTYEAPLRQFFNAAEFTKISRVGGLQKYIENQTKLLKIAEKKLFTSFEGKLANSTPQEIFNKIYKANNVNEINTLKNILKNNPEVYKAFQKEVLSDLSERVLKPNDKLGMKVLDPRAFDKFLNGRSGEKGFRGALEQIFGKEYVKNLDTLNEALQITARQPASKAAEGVVGNFFTDLVRARLGQFTFAGRIFTAGRRIFATTSNRMIKDAILNPESLADFVRLRQLKKGSKRAAIILGKLGGSIFILPDEGDVVDQSSNENNTIKPKSIDDQSSNTSNIEEIIQTTDNVMTASLPDTIETGDTAQLQTPPLDTVGVNPASFDNKIMAQDANGLTQSEQAFLDDEEKAMRLRSRGMTA